LLRYENAEHENARREIAGHEKQDNAKFRLCTACWRPGVTVYKRQRLTQKKIAILFLRRETN